MNTLVLLVLSQAARDYRDAPVHREPTYLGESRQVAQSMEQAMAQLNDRLIKINSDEGLTTIELAGKKVRESHGAVTWAFDGRRIYIRDRSKHLFVEGKCLRHRAVELVSKVTGKRVDVITRSLLFRQAPFSSAFIDATVRLVGFVAPNGVPCDILTAESKAFRTTFFVRRADHLPKSITSESLINGKTVSSTRRTLTYSRAATSNFTLVSRPGEHLGKLPVLKRETI